MKSYFALCVIFLLLAAQASLAQIPKTISYQGILSEAGAKVDGEKTITFKLYETETGGTALWDNYKILNVQNGVFEVVLGEDKPLNLPFDKQYWLGIKVGAGAELTPRIPLTSAAYSLNAQSVADGTITSKKIADDVVVRSINQIKENVLIKAGNNITISSADSTITISANVSQMNPNSLDKAYDQGGTGAGRTITADAGAVNIAGNGGLTVNGNVGIGTTNPAQMLDVKGTAQVNGFKMPTGAANGYVLQSDANGVGAWKPAASNGIGGSGTVNYLPRFNGSSNLTNSRIYQYKNRIGIGTTGPGALLDLESTASQDGIDINNTAGNGDPVIRFQLSGSTVYTMGIDDNDYDKFKIGVGNLTNNTRLTIDGSGRVGIGTTAPNAHTKLDVYNNNYHAGRFTSSMANNYTKVLSSECTGTGNYNPIAVWGKAKPATGYGYGGKFYGGHIGAYGQGDNYGVYGLVSDSYGTNRGVEGIANYGSVNYGVYGNTYSSSSSAYSYGVFGSASGSGYRYAVYASGNLVYTGSFYQASDQKFKENIQPLNDALPKLKKLKVKTYNFKKDQKYKDFNFSEGKHYGLIAQEVEEVFPEFVTEIAHPTKTDAEGKDEEPVKYKGVSYTELIPVLIKAVQEQQAMIDKQQKEIDDLAAKVNTLMAK